MKARSFMSSAEATEEGIPDPDQSIRFGPAPPPGHGRNEAAGTGDPDSAVDDGIGAVAGEGLHEPLSFGDVVTAKGDEAGDADSEEQRVGIEKSGRRRGEKAPIDIQEHATEGGIGAAGHEAPGAGGVPAGPESPASQGVYNAKKGQGGADSNAQEGSGQMSARP
jgi:hypothetical protein